MNSKAIGTLQNLNTFCFNFKRCKFSVSIGWHANKFRFSLNIFGQLLLLLFFFVVAQRVITSVAFDSFSLQAKLFRFKAISGFFEYTCT